MSVVDLLVTIIVVTILVTIALGVVTYVAYKLRLARRPTSDTEDTAEPRYFVAHEPPRTDEPAEETPVSGSEPATGDESPAGEEPRAS